MSSTTLSEPSATASLVSALDSVVGKAHVLSAGSERRRIDRRKKKRKGQPARQVGLESFAIDQVIPEAVVSPGTTEEVAAILRIASERGYTVVPAGGMTQQSTGAVPDRIDVLLRTNRLNKLLHYDAGDLTMGAGAGITISELQKILSANSQMLPLDPMHSATATIGGVLASNAHGPMKAGYGGVRDYCIGVEFVTGDGKVAKGGGRVVKNVAGYDMMKLMIGSYGTLGVITAANFKVFPAPQNTRTFVCECSSIVEAMALRDRIMASPLSPICFEIASPLSQEYLTPPAVSRNPDHYSPAAHVPRVTSWNIFIRASGSDNVLARYRRQLGSAVSREISGKDEDQLWRFVSDFPAAVVSRHQNAMIVNVNVSPSQVGASLVAAEQSAVEHNLLSAIVGRISAGALVCAFIPLAVDPPSAMQFANAVSAFRGRLSKDASAVVVRCPVEAKRRFDVWGTSPNDVAIMRAVRAAMDPQQVLNRGRFLA